MEELQELIRVVNSYKVKNIEIIGSPPPKKSKIQLFYKKLLTNEICCDEIGGRKLYGTCADDRNYKELKKRLFDRLLNTLFFIDVKRPKYNEQQRAYYTCWKLFAAAKILTGKSANKVSVFLLKKVLPKAVKYEFTELVVGIARMLRVYYGNQMGNYRMFEHYNQTYKQYEAVLHAERLADEYYSRVYSKIMTKREAASSIHQEAIQAYEALQPYLERFENFRLHFSARLLLMTAHNCIGDHNETIKVCEEALSFFSNKEYEQKNAIVIFLHQLIVCYTQLRNFERGKALMEALQDYHIEGTFNWFSTHHTFLILAIHSKNYQSAYDQFITLKSHHRYPFLSSNLIEKFKIIEAYLYYLVEIGQIQPHRNVRAKFRISKFLNEVPQYSRDKKGLNIPILIVQILFLIVQKKYSKAIDRIEAVEKYCYRYLKKNDMYRSNCFLRMLLQIPASSFNSTAAERRAQKYWVKLNEVPFDIGKHTDEVEIIPYEDLWPLVLGHLCKK